MNSEQDISYILVLGNCRIAIFWIVRTSWLKNVQYVLSPGVWLCTETCEDWNWRSPCGPDLISACITLRAIAVNVSEVKSNPTLSMKNCVCIESSQENNSWIKTIWSDGFRWFLWWLILHKFSVILHSCLKMAVKSFYELPLPVWSKCWVAAMFAIPFLESVDASRWTC